MSLQHASSFRDLKEILAADADVGNSIEVSYEIKERAHMLCSKFLGGAWKSVAVDDLCLTRMKGGMSNMLFLCKFPEDQKEKLTQGEPDKTLLRVYFNPETESHLVAESVIFTLLSERQLGPRLYGIFNGGRLEEYIVSRPLSCSEITKEEISIKIARKLARIHTLHVPISKEPTYLCEALERWIERLRICCPNLSVPVSVTCVDRTSNGNSNKVRLIDLEELTIHFYSLKRAICRSKSPVVFCHNDLQEGNILLPKEECGKDLVVIDFEYASYNYRAFDFGNHFCEWTITYGLEDPPHYSINMDHFPTVEEQKKFIRTYLENIVEPSSAAQSCLLGGENQLTDENLERFREEIESFVPVSHFFWGVWALLQVELSPVRFGFADYARDRLSLYFQLRHNLSRLINKKESSVSSRRISGFPLDDNYFLNAANQPIQEPNTTCNNVTVAAGNSAGISVTVDDTGKK